MFRLLEHPMVARNSYNFWRLVGLGNLPQTSGKPSRRMGLLLPRTPLERGKPIWH